MVSIRNQRRMSRRRLRLSGTPSDVRGTEQNVHSNHDCSGDKKADIQVDNEEKRSVHSEEQGRHQELEREVDLNVVGREHQELLVTVTEKLSVPATADVMASSIDHVRSKRALTDSTTPVPMSPTLEVYIECPRADLQPEHGGLGVDIEQLELQRAGAGPSRAGLSRLPDFVFPEGDTQWPGVPADDTSDGVDGGDDEDDKLDPDWKIPEVESGIMSTCRQLAGNRQMRSGAELEKYLFGSAFASESRPEIRQYPRRIRREDADSATPEIIVGAEVPSPPETPTLKRRHFLRAYSTVNNDLDEDHPLRNPEGSLPHSLYLQVLAYGQEGILLEDLLNSFHCQSLAAMLTDDWEDEVVDYLNHNPYFDQVRGYYLLSEFHVRRTPKWSAIGEEKESPGSTIGFNQGCGAKTREANGIQGSMEAKQVNIQEEGRSCSLTVLQPERKQPWQCRLMAMEGQEFCEHHCKKGVRPEEREAIDLTKSTRLSKGKEKAPSNWRVPARIKEPIEKLGPHSLRTMQAKIIAKHGVQEGGRRCALKNARSWQCPMTAMEGRTRCEHHYKQAQAWLKQKKSLGT